MKSRSTVRSPLGNMPCSDAIRILLSTAKGPGQSAIDRRLTCTGNGVPLAKVTIVLNCHPFTSALRPRRQTAPVFLTAAERAECRSDSIRIDAAGRRTTGPYSARKLRLSCAELQLLISQVFDALSRDFEKGIGGKETQVMGITFLEPHLQRIVVRVREVFRHENVSPDSDMGVSNCQRLTRERRQARLVDIEPGGEFVADLS